MSALNIERRITFDALSPVFQNLHCWAIVPTAIPMLAVAVLWSNNRPSVLTAWLMAMLLGIFAKHRFINRYQHHKVRESDAKRWHIGLLVSTGYLSLLWVVATLIFFEEQSAPHQVFMITVAVTLGMSSVAYGTRWPPLHYVYGIPILMALVLRLALVGSLPYLALACLMLMALLASVRITKQFNGVIRSEMRTHYSSAGLVQELQQKTDEAQNVVREKSRILATASHDLRQPLHAITLYIDALRDTHNHNKQENQRIFYRLDTCLGLLRKQFDGILDISRLDANAVEPELHHFDIRDCLESLQREYQGEFINRNLCLRVHSPNAAVYSDRALLERILRNLITNALRYTRSGGVLIAARPRKHHVLIQVIDTGIGIPQDKQETVFIEFQRLEIDDPQQDRGLGFGLAIVKRLCAILNSPLELQSRVGHGSIFSIQCPIGKKERITDRHSHQSGLLEDYSEQKLVLVIDSDPDVRDSMHTLLSRWGLKVISADSLSDMLAKVAGEKKLPDLILSGLSVNHAHKGMETIDQLRGRYRSDIPGILVTGTTDPKIVNMAISSDYRLIQKPVNPSALRSIIQHQLR